jgi:aerobic carbon-monoxide dehydrogenase small subunit
MKLEFRLNGQAKSLETPAFKKVVDVLREDCGLFGTKTACGSGDCGACTILVNGETKVSCLMLAGQIQNCEIITIEGMSQIPQYHLLQKMFIEYGAVQCGYCTPGMILAAAYLLKTKPNATRLEIKEGLAGNLCRCTGYQKIIEAIEQAIRVGQDQNE